MDLPHFLTKCRRDQWSVNDLDWKQSPRAMSAADEEAIVQYFTDMATIERLAGALFREQERRVADPVLKAIFRTFIVDEARHAAVAERLARFYDVRRLRAYRTSASLERFAPHFVDAIRYLSDDVANAYVTAGELMLDIALLRSVNDYVNDDMSAAAMKLVNRDESRHIAIDYHMVEYYASAEYLERLAKASRDQSMGNRARAWWAFAHVLYYAKPFFRDVFFLPMSRVDPTGTRLREAIRRFQLLGEKPGVGDRPFGRFLLTMQDVFNHPVAGKVLGPLAARLAGMEPEFMAQLNSEGERARAKTMSYAAMAEEALAAKGADA